MVCARVAEVASPFPFTYIGYDNVPVALLTFFQMSTFELWERTLFWTQASRLHSFPFFPGFVPSLPFPSLPFPSLLRDVHGRDGSSVELRIEG